MVTQADRRIGSVIDSRYRLLRVLGSGGMGVVYQAEQLLLQQQVALKLLHTHLRSHPRGRELQQRFLREAQSLARLGGRHPHIAAVVDCGVCEDGTLFMAMELLEGEPLCDVISRGPLPPARALHIAVQMLRTLIHAHGKGVVHRDLKPDNVMLTHQDGRNDFVKLLDFGIAKLLSEAQLESAGPGLSSPEAAQELGGAAPQPLTRAGVIFGTPEYLAPEQAQGQEVDQRVDIYAVGCVLWEMLAGRRPFVGTSALEVISMHLTKEPEPPSAHSPTPLPPLLDEVVLRAMAKRPEERFASAEEFLRALDPVLDQVGRQLDGRTSTGRVLTPLFEGIRRAVTVEWRALPPPPLASSLSLQAAPRQRLWDRLAARLGVRGAAVLAAALLLVGLVGLVGLLVRVGGARPAAPRPAPSVPAPAPPPAPAAPSATPAPVPLPASPATVSMESLIERLEQGRRCEERRSAALGLLALGDPRALGPLQQARRRAGGRGAPNACMRRELDEAIEKLRAAGAAPGIHSVP